MEEMAGKLPNTDVLMKSQVTMVASEPCDDVKWPRRWRLLFIMGVSLALWAAIIASVRML